MATMMNGWNEAQIDECIPETREGWRAERKLYRLLRDRLPNDWVVFYDKTIQYGDERHGQEAQLDFLVVVPGMGIVNVDAKGEGYHVQPGGNIALNPNGRDVFEEANRGIHVFDNYVRKNHLRNDKITWGAFGSLVVFAFSNFNGRLAGGHHYLQAEDLADPDSLQNGIRRVLQHYHYAFGNFEAYRQGIIGHLSNSGIIANPVAVDYDGIERYSIRGLDDSQREVCSLLNQRLQNGTNAYLHVMGGAGTGKTLIALTSAKTFADAGNRVLYVCFNKALKKSLGLDLRYYRPRNDGRLIVSNFHALGQDLTNQNLIINGANGFDRRATDDNIANRLPELMRRQNVQKFDAMFIDEAQDLTLENIRFLLSLCRRHRCITVFSDAGQNIYSCDWNGENLNRIFDQEVQELTLHRNYRNSIRIFEHFKDLSLDNSTPMLIESDNFRPKDVGDNMALNGVQQKIAELMNEGRTASEIVVLSESNRGVENLVSVRNPATGANVYFTDDIEKWTQGRMILKATVHAFKGLEANCVILLGGNGHLPQDDRNRLRYVGESRAKYELYIVNG